MMQKNCKRNHRGFSLIELIVVILIMSILAVSLTPQVMKWVDNSRKASDLNYMHTLESAVQFALMDVGVQAEVASALGASGDDYLVLTVKNSDDEDDPGTKDWEKGTGTELFQKTASHLGVDVTELGNHATKTSGGVIEITFTGGRAIGIYKVNGESVDLTNE